MFTVSIGRIDEYKRAKTILNRGNHPAFIGHSPVERNAENGGLLFFQIEGEDAAVAVVNARKSILIVFNVLPKFRGSGLGKQIIEYLRPNFARVVESAVPFFIKCGYEPLGEMKMGQSLKTQIMVRSNLLGLSGRLRAVLDPGQILIPKSPFCPPPESVSKKPERRSASKPAAPKTKASRSTK